MGNVTIYLPGDLAEKARRHGLNISRAAQKQLAREIRLAERRAATKGTAAMLDARGVSTNREDRGATR